MQKKKSNGSSVKVKTCKTLGTKERRTVNLKKGSYRVLVLGLGGRRRTPGPANAP